MRRFIESTETHAVLPADVGELCAEANREGYILLSAQQTKEGLHRLTFKRYTRWEPLDK